MTVSPACIMGMYMVCETPELQAVTEIQLQH